jgi:ribosomal protein L12E/L44/L45/RPP1/RPP2
MPIKRNLALLQKKKMDELVDIYNMVVAPISATSAASTPTDDNNKKMRKADRIKEIEIVLSRDYLELIDDYKYAAATAASTASASSACADDGDGDGDPSTQNIVLGTKKTKVNYTYAHDLDMITYGRNLMKHMDAILYPAPDPASALSSPASALSSPPRIDMMIIENQISTIATRMKTLQGMITQYFIMKNVPQIEFISASCKLKLFTDSMLDVSKYVDATTYGDRKKAGITICRALGKMTLPPPASTNYATWMPMFEKHKKKDDLADCFLQCLWRVHLLMGV